MRILYISDIFPTVSQVFITREIVALEKKGVKIKVFSLHRPQEKVKHTLNNKVKAEVFYGESVKAGKARKALRHGVYFLSTPKNYIIALQSSGQTGLPGLHYKFTQTPLVCDKIGDFKPDKIHCHFGREGMLYGWMLSKLLNIPFSVTLHGSDVLVSPYKNLGTVLKDAEKIVCISQQIRDVLIKNFSVSPQKACLIRCGISLHDFHPVPILSSDLKILCVARMHRVKGISYLVEACDALERRNIQFECNIYGDGAERDALEKLVEQLGLIEKVHLCGAVANEELPEIYANHSLFVLPSLSEGAPVVLMEAMASGLPVVASNVGGIPELIEDHVNGFLVEPGKPEKLAEAIIKIQTLSDDEIQTIRNLNQEKVERHFNASREIKKIFSLLEDTTYVVEES